MIIATNYKIISQKDKQQKTLYSSSGGANPPILSNLLEDIPLSEIDYCKIQNLDVPVLCPDCRSEIKVRDTKRRFVRDDSGKRIPFALKRYYCACCKKLHTELPDILLPYYRYEKRIIEKVREGDARSFSGDGHTMRRWRKK